jgi:hypothetical protein
LLTNDAKRAALRQVVRAWHGEAAADLIAARMLQWTAGSAAGQVAHVSETIPPKPGVLHV